MQLQKNDFDLMEPLKFVRLEAKIHWIAGVAQITILYFQELEIIVFQC